MAAIPSEIIAEILSRLPVKPLYRFKCVSKPWNSLINSSKFIKLHLNQTLISNPNPNLVISHFSLISAPISAVNDRVLRFSELDHPLKNLPGRPAVELIEACNGVLLIADYQKKFVFLYNPSTKSHRLLPPAPCRRPKPGPESGLVEVFGFGYDGINDDYKVVRLLQWYSDAGFCREAAVYSLRNDSWSFVEDETMPFFVQRSNAVLAKEMLHFVVVRKDFTPLLNCFDLRTEKFSLVDYPEMDGYDVSKVIMSMRELRGCFCLLVNYQKHIVDPSVAVCDPLYNRRFLHADVWEMRERGKKESWVKLYRIRKRDIVERCMHLRLVTYSRDNGSVLVEVDGMWFGWYNLGTKKIEKVSIQGLQPEHSPYVAWTSVDSLVSVSKDKDKPVSKGGVEPTKKSVKKSVFLSSGFKLRL